MNKWLVELKQYINDEEIIKYYSDEIKSLNTDNYFDICKAIGRPSKIAKEEQKQNKKVSFDVINKPENLKIVLFGLAPLVILFLITFISSFGFLISEFKAITMFYKINNTHVVQKILMSLSNLIFRFSLSYILFTIIEYLMFKLNNKVYIFNKPIIIICTLFSVLGMVLMIMFGTNVNDFDKRHHIHDYERQMLKHKKSD